MWLGQIESVSRPVLPAQRRCHDQECSTSKKRAHSLAAPDGQDMILTDNATRYTSEQHLNAALVTQASAAEARQERVTWCIPFKPLGHVPDTADPWREILIFDRG